MTDSVFRPEREIILNKPLRIRGQEAVLAALASYGGKSCLWLFYHRPLPEWLLRGEPEASTHREEREHAMLDARLNRFWPQSLCIQGHLLSFTSAGALPLSGNPEARAPFEYFTGKGVSSGALAHIPERDISVMHCSFEDESIFSVFEPSLPPGLALTVGSEHEELPVHARHSLTPGAPPEEKRFTFTRPDGTECGYYLNGLSLHDFPAPTPEQRREAAKQMRAQGLSDAQIARIQKSERNACPEGHKLLALAYESEGDIQLSFYTEAYLDAAPEYTGGAASIAVLVSENEKGPHGHREQCCCLGPVPETLTGQVELELFSFYRRLPEETIRIDG